MKNLTHLQDISKIYSDFSKRYKAKELEKADFKHLTVNHKYNFVHQTMDNHTHMLKKCVVLPNVSSKHTA